MACLLLAGCASVGVPVALTEAERGGLGAFPERPYGMEQSVVFTLRGRSFAGFGMTRVSPQERHFASSCLTAQGITVFELEERGGRLEVLSTLPEMGDPAVVGEAFAGSIRAVYFDNLPPEDAAWSLEGGCWVAVSARPDGGSLLHRFGCADGRLLEKRCLTRRGRVAWSVAFADYDGTGPRRMEVRDNTARWPYTLAIRVRAWSRGGEE